jgi:hypothetical protein
MSEPKELKLTVDGKEMTLKPFIHKFILGTILGMLDSLKGVEDPSTINITINDKN